MQENVGIGRRREKALMVGSISLRLCGKHICPWLGLAPRAQLLQQSAWLIHIMWWGFTHHTASQIKLTILRTNASQARLFSWSLARFRQDRGGAGKRRPLISSGRLAAWQNQRSLLWPGCAGMLVRWRRCCSCALVRNLHGAYWPATTIRVLLAGNKEGSRWLRGLRVSVLASLISR